MLSELNSPHTLKWVKGLVEHEIEILVFGLLDHDESLYSGFSNVRIDSYGYARTVAGTKGWGLKKLRYVLSLKRVRKIVKEFKPDIIHAHLASSYGLIGALSGCHPFVVSVWGSDVFTFPRKSMAHKSLLRYVLKKADKVCSTSRAMAMETARYTNKEIEIIPFGIDVEKFKPRPVKSLFKEGDIVIGTVKALEDKYGIEYLLKAFKILCDKHPKLPLKLLVVGGGSSEKRLKDMANDLDIIKNTVFTGKVLHEDVEKFHNMLSVFVNISDYESFGVSVLEASACEKPVVVSNVGGLPEVVDDGVTGFVVPPRNPLATAKAIERLILDSSLRTKMGSEGRKRVKKYYNWDENLLQMVNVYKDLVN